MDINNKPHVTYEMLQALITAPGKLDIHIHQLRGGYFVPFVMFTPPGMEQTGYGPIVHEGDLVAAGDAQELITALRESLGERPTILMASTPPAPVPLGN